jgi:hypothetical protein
MRGKFDFQFLSYNTVRIYLCYGCRCTVYISHRPPPPLGMDWKRAMGASGDIKSPRFGMMGKLI